MKALSQKYYWDSVAGEKRFPHPLHHSWLASHFTVAHTILECGCGYGGIVGELIQNGCHHTVGADFSDGMLRRSRQLTPHLTLVQANVDRLPFANGSFDAVLLFVVLTSMPMEDQQRALFSKVRRILRTGGLVYVSDLLLNTDRRNVDRYEHFAKQSGTYGIFQLPEGVIVRHHIETWIRSLTEQFDCVAYETFTVATMNGHSSAAFQFLGRLR